MRCAYCNNVLCEHRQASEAGKRMADIVNGKLAAHPFDELKSSWMAFKLFDGSSDGNLYDSKADAVRHQLDEFSCAYMCLRNLLGGVTARDATLFIEFNRRAYDAGFRMSDPQDIITPTTREHLVPKYRTLLS